MSSDNPYESPHSSALARGSPLPSLAQGDEKIARYAQLFLRLLGVYLVVAGASGVVGSVVYLMTMTPSDRLFAGEELEPRSYSLSWIASSVVLAAAGLYLVIGGRWLIETVFLASAPQDVDETRTELPDQEP